MHSYYTENPILFETSPIKKKTLFTFSTFVPSFLVDLWICDKKKRLKFLIPLSANRPRKQLAERKD